MNGWRIRLLVLLLFYVVGQVHDEVAAPWPNTRAWMFAYHGSAALCDLFLLACSARFFKGRLSFDMQILCLLCILVNGFGYFAYRYYWPAAPYNMAMTSLIFLQFVRLLILDRHDFDTLRNLFRGSSVRRPQHHSGKGSA